MLTPTLILKRTRQDKACEKQIAMIAQKVVDANQPKWKGRSFVASSQS
jgi:hypothetical protein